MSIVAELLLTRHGQAHCNEAGLVGGPKTCTGLTELGRRQTYALAARLRADYHDRPPAVVYAGPRLRLRQSGGILADTLRAPLIIEPGLDGPVHGDADGRSWFAVESDFGGSPDTKPDQQWASGSETWNQYLQRATEFLSALLARHEHDQIVLSCHAETVTAAHGLLLGLSADPGLGFVTEHASLTRWQRHETRFGHLRWLLDRHNDTAHLQDICTR